MRLIDADKVLDDILQAIEPTNYDYTRGVSAAYDIVRSAPTVDAKDGDSDGES